MAQKLKIYTIEYNLQHDDVVNLKCFSRGALIDADVVLVDPDAIYRKILSINQECDGLYAGKPILYESYSRDVYEMFERRKEEIRILLRNGKTIFVFLEPEYEVNIIEQVSHEWKGSKRINMRHLSSVSNYSFLPFHFDYREGSGSSVAICSRTPFESITNPLKDHISYSAYFPNAPENSIVFAVTPSTKNPVGVVMKCGNGNIVFLPIISMDKDKKIQIFVKFLIDLTRILHEGTNLTPEPDWSGKLEIPGEAKIKEEMNNVEQQLKNVKGELDKKYDELLIAQSWKRLLYEKGKPLEQIVQKAFEILGFTVSQIKNSIEEHDVILTSDEGRALGEIEGKDTKAINVDKFRQLSTNLDEDFEKTGSYAKGILIGNGFRLTEPNARPCQFTERVITGATTKKFALLTTYELYRAIVYILEHHEDATFAANCRKKIFETNGDIGKLEIP